MALDVIQPPLQLASVGVGGSYGNGQLSSSLIDSPFSAENCNPNTDKGSVTPGKPKKTPVRPKAAALTEAGPSDSGKPPVRRRLESDGGPNEAPFKSPGKAVAMKETSVSPSPHKHFCRSPRCAANNPDYNVPAPRQYLKSRRHLLAGWQPPVNSKLKASVHTANSSHVCSSHHDAEGEHFKEQQHDDDHLVSASGGYDGESNGAHPSNDDSQRLDTQEAVTGQFLNGVDDQHDLGDKIELEPSPVRDLSLDNSDAVVVASSTCISIREEEVAVSVPNHGVWMMRGDSLRASTKTESDISMRSIGEDGFDSRRETVSSGRHRRRRYQKKGGRRVSSGTASNQSVKLNRQEGLKRKQADEWMWDTAVKDAVQRLAPQAPLAGSVNVIVKAFESVKLTEEEIMRAKYKKDRLALEGLSSFQGRCGGFNPHVSPMEAIASISKVQAWDESMASADLVDDSRSEKVSHDGGSGASTPKRSLTRLPPFSSKSEPPKERRRARWVIASDESMNGMKDDGCSDRGTSSISGKSRTTEWTCGSKSQAGRSRTQKLKRSTSLHPFRLRTEERGAVKEFLFSKRLQQLWEQEERLRIPLAQGLPWTTEEPAVPPKPLVKELTKAEGFKLFTDLRAVERAEFDEYVAERNSQMELLKREEERQRQIAEIEEVRRLRREMVPRAQLMPYFDRPFMPRRSSKKLTVPKEPKFHLKQNKRPRCMASCNSVVASRLFN